MLAEPSQLKTANALNGVKVTTSNSSIVAARPCDTKAQLCNMQLRERATEGESGLVRIALGAEPNR